MTRATKTTDVSPRLLRELLRGFWVGTWDGVRFDAPPCPKIPTSLAMEIDGDVATVSGPKWTEKGSIVAAHALLERVWDRLGWPTVREFRGNYLDCAHGWEDGVYTAIGARLLELAEGWPPARRARLLAVLRTHDPSHEGALEVLAKRTRTAAVFRDEYAASTADEFEGHRTRNALKLLGRSAELFAARTTLSRYALLRDSAAFVAAAGNPTASVVKRASPALVPFDPCDELAIGALMVREAVACHALTGRMDPEIALSHLDALLEAGAIAR